VTTLKTPAYSLDFQMQQTSSSYGSCHRHVLFETQTIKHHAAKTINIPVHPLGKIATKNFNTPLCHKSVN